MPVGRKCNFAGIAFVSRIRVGRTCGFADFALVSRSRSVRLFEEFLKLAEFQGAEDLGSGTEVQFRRHCICAPNSSGTKVRIRCFYTCIPIPSRCGAISKPLRLLIMRGHGT